jgi:hypothetical protein
LLTSRADLGTADWNFRVVSVDGVFECGMPFGSPRIAMGALRYVTSVEEVALQGPSDPQRVLYDCAAGRATPAEIAWCARNADQ